MAEQRELPGFEVTRAEFDLLQRYVGYLGDDRVLLALYEAEPKLLGILKECVAEPMDTYFREGTREYRNPDLLTRRVLAYFGIEPQEFDRLKELDQEIRHYLNVQVSLKDIGDLQKDVEAVRDARLRPAREQELDEKHERGEISREQYKAGLKDLDRLKASAEFDHEGRKLNIEYVPNHYYLPVLLDEQGRADYIKHVIRTPSEVRFVRDLEQYLAEGGTGFGEYDWWMFSKLDESLDEVYIPYYDPQQNRIRDFKPDFVFWLQKGKQYHIVFVDPKGTTVADYQRKLDGYQALFEQNGTARLLNWEETQVTVHTLLYSKQAGAVARGYRRFWVRNVAAMLEQLKGATSGKVVLSR